MKMTPLLRRCMPVLAAIAILMCAFIFLSTGFWLRVVSTCDRAQDLSNRTTYLDGLVCRYHDTHEAIKPPSTRSLR
ncbi:hypothetical protein [Providencia huaxiensis]|uniref:hypothetical protein n=1 Tax=Providencia huaxiensis TaxID=2027290 RepID=UPI000E109DA3|nr:hypothetical protein [Providencia huaxiensis]AXH61579.1 hypothetical protein CYG50_05805 [Providencia huaxiensis]